MNQDQSLTDHVSVSGHSLTASQGRHILLNVQIFVAACLSPSEHGLGLVTAALFILPGIISL